MITQLCRTILILFTLLFVGPAFAAKIKKVDGKKVLVELEGDSAKVGDVFVAYDPDGKRRGLIKIKVVKGDKAAGVLGKGKVENGWTVKVSDKSQRTAKSSGSDKHGAGSGSHSGDYWGLIGGMSMDSMKVKVDNDANGVNETSVSMSGSSFSLKGFYDAQVFGDIWFRGMGGVEGLAASGSTQAGCGGKTCDANIYYLGGDFWGRWVLPFDSFRPWIGGAFSLMFPLSKKSTALESGSITNTSSLSAGGGFDWIVSPTLMIPFQAEYSMLPKSETVEATAIAVRVGFAVPF